MRRGLVLSFLPGICNLATFVLVLLVIFSGFDGRLTEFYWLRVDTSALSSAAKLSNSDFLSAISKISGTDLIGKNVTAASLGLPDWTGVHLMAECSHFSDGRIECSRPRYGFQFRPERDLNIGRLGGIDSSELRDALDTQRSASRFVAGAHVFTAVCSLLVPIEAWFSPLLATVTCGITTLVLFACSITATVVFRHLSDAWNAEFNTAGLTSKPGTIPVVLDFLAFFLTMLATVFYVLQHRRQSRGYYARPKRRGVKAHSVGERGLGEADYEGGNGDGSGGDGPGIWGRKDHKYVQIQEQQEVKALADNDGAPNEELLRAPGSPDSVGRPRRLDDDWAAPDDYHAGAEAAPPASAKTSSGPSIPLMTLGGNKGTKDLNTAYEPYSDPR